MQTKFFSFFQNTTGAKYLHNPRLGIGITTIIEAASLTNAITRAKKLGIHDTTDGECPHCASKRWNFNNVSELTYISNDGYEKMQRMNNPLCYLHTKSGVFAELNSKHPFSIQSATELLLLNEQHKLNLRSSEIVALKSHTEPNNTNPVLRILDPLREPPSMVKSKFTQHEVLCSALEMGIITLDVYKVMQKTTMTPVELKSFQNQIQHREIDKAIAAKQVKRCGKVRPIPLDVLYQELRNNNLTPEYLTRPAPAPAPQETIQPITINWHNTDPLA